MVIAGIIFVSCWHFLGVKAAETAFLDVDSETGEKKWLDPRQVKKEVKKKYAQMPTLFDRARTDNPIFKRNPIEIADTKFDLDS